MVVQSKNIVTLYEQVVLYKLTVHYFGNYLLKKNILLAKHMKSSVQGIKLLLFPLSNLQPTEYQDMIYWQFYTVTITFSISEKQL